jgi:phage baseplate assembly protein W
MRGTDSTTGKAIDGMAHLRQSIRDILTTPLGSRVMRRDYGSRLFMLVDSPLGPATRAAFTAATSAALKKWEPRFAFDSLELATSSPSGRVTIYIKGRHRPEDRPLDMEVTL